jgi:gamma-glutamyl:cysteine ligase YbdK (ATP-grasp superfamily)
MGQEISLNQFDPGDFANFLGKLREETLLFGELFAHGAFSNAKPKIGYEIEAWLIDHDMRPAPVNRDFLAALKDPLASAELAKFNIELNGEPQDLSANVFSRIHRQIEDTWSNVRHCADSLDLHPLMIGILPTLEQALLNLDNMSEMHRYKALNEQILQARGRPIHIDIHGNEHLRFDHDDVMLEAAATSFQLHIQLPPDIAHHFYNAAIIASAPMVAVCANSPFLFGKELWQETRIPLFEQAIETGGYDGAAHGPLRRVSFGSDFARHSLMECFQENLAHFPVLLPVLNDADSAKFAHLRLHNGTIWRWNRPLVGFDLSGTPHIRIEHRTPAAGPSIADTVANAAFFYGLSQNLCDEIIANGIPLSFTQAKDNFYQAAHHGIEGVIVWFDGHKHRLDHLFAQELLARAKDGLASLGVDIQDSETYLGIIRERLANKQTGSRWQSHFIKEHGRDFQAMTRNYLANQLTGVPVSQWRIG